MYVILNIGKMLPIQFIDLGRCRSIFSYDDRENFQITPYHHQISNMIH